MVIVIGYIPIHLTQQSSGGSYNKLFNISRNSVIVGGEQNTLSYGFYTAMIGGLRNYSYHAYNSAVIGGYCNCMNNARRSTLIGGYGNCIVDAQNSAIIGGQGLSLNGSNNDTVLVPNLMVNGSIFANQCGTSRQGVNCSIGTVSYMNIVNGIIVGIS